jgi:hypothetical protein
MNKKANILIENRLLEARKESLKQLNSTAMRPHGKLWGMDVFSWFHPEAELVANTLHSFPFPVIWIANGDDIIAALHEEELVVNNLHALIAYDSSIFDLENSWLKNINIVAGTASISEAFQLLNVFKAPHKVLLFTASGANWEEDKQSFEEFLKLVQV